MEKEKRPLSGRIHKTTSSRIALIGVAAASMMITVSIVGAIQLQEASAAKPSHFCYEVPSVFNPCFLSMEECRAHQANDPTALGPCKPVVTRGPPSR